MRQIWTYVFVTRKSKIGEHQASVVEPLGAFFRLVQMDEGGGCTFPQPDVPVPVGYPSAAL